MIRSTLEGPLGIRNLATVWSLDSVRSHLQFAISNGGFRCSDSTEVSPVEDQINFGLIQAAQKHLRSRSTGGLPNLGFRVQGGWNAYRIYSPADMGGFHEELTGFSSNFYFDDYGYLNEWDNPHEMMGFSTFRDLHENVSLTFDQYELDKTFCCPLYTFWHACQWQRRQIHNNEAGHASIPFQLHHFVDTIVSFCTLRRNSVLQRRLVQHCGHCTVDTESSAGLNTHLLSSPTCLQWSVHNL